MMSNQDRKNFIARIRRLTEEWNKYESIFNSRSEGGLTAKLQKYNGTGDRISFL